MRLFYTICIRFYALGIRLVSPFHTKARQMVRGWNQCKRQLDSIAADKRPTLWFHASSLGEFEQARPVLERLHADHPNHRICVTFFSPSGYEVRHNYPLADVVLYLPPDTPRNARRMVASLHPEMMFFVKYDFWFNYLEALRIKKIPTYIFSAIFRPSQYFFKSYGGWYCRQLSRCFTHIFVQNEASLQLLQHFGIEHCSLAGDTRFDRVKAIAEKQEPFPSIDRYLSLHANIPVLLAGSSWPPDEEMIDTYLQCHPERPLTVILAPHVIAESHLTEIEQRFGTTHCVRYSQLERSDDDTLRTRRVLIIDNIGMLASLYRYAHVAYIGGGWGHGIHNILEAITFGKPVIFGPNYHKFQEAHDILACGGGFTYNTYDALQRSMDPLLDDADYYQTASQACRQYVEANLGSTEIIVEALGNKNNSPV